MKKKVLCRSAYNSFHDLWGFGMLFYWVNPLDSFSLASGTPGGGGATPRVLGRQLPLPPPLPPRGLRPTVS